MSSFQPWQIYHLDLSESLPPELVLASGYQGLYLVFWWHGIPLGHHELSPAQLPMSATQLMHLAVQTITPAVGDRLFENGFKAPLPITRKRSPRRTPPDVEAVIAVERPLTTLHAKLTNYSSDLSVSVVICTRDRPDQLVQCLRSLQALSPSPLEVIVVDNAPTSDATYHRVTQWQTSYPELSIHYVKEPRPGLSIARNTGIQHTTGDLIAFTDDDVMVHPNWVARLQRAFHNPQVMAVTGLVLPGSLDTEAQVIFEKGLGGFSQGYRAKLFDRQFFEAMCDRGVPVWRIGAGANMAFRRHAFEEVGLFHEQLGAGAAGCSEDSELWYRLLAAGWCCYYDPAVVVFHHHRGSLAELKQQAFQYMRGHVTALLIQFQQHGHWGNLHRLAIALPRYYSQLVRRAITQRLKSRYSTLFAEISGCLSGVRFYLHHRASISAGIRDGMPARSAYHPLKKA
jgi:GT2 family glycosyltransferase